VLSQGPNIKEEMMEKNLVVNDDVVVVDDVIVDDVVVDDVVVDDVVVDDDDAIDDGGEPKVEDWMKDDGEQTPDDVMPVSAHIRAKRKLKGRIEGKNTEIEELRKEIEDLKKQKLTPPLRDETLVRPKEGDYESIEAYYTALEEYEDKRIDSKLSVVHGQRQLRDTQTKAIEKLNKAVDDHYVRADKLVKESGISAETYKQSDEAIRNAIEAVRPGQGNIIVDQMISLLGEGSEKVMYKLGRSNALRGELITLLTEDPHGLRATAFLGEQRAKLLLTKRRTSNAPTPASEINGDSTSSNKERVFKKKYEAAHAKGSAQAAYNAKKDARAAGVDTSKW